MQLDVFISFLQQLLIIFNFFFPIVTNCILIIFSSGKYYLIISNINLQNPALFCLPSCATTAVQTVNFGQYSGHIRQMWIFNKSKNAICVC